MKSNQKPVSRLVTRADGLGLHQGKREGLYLLQVVRRLGEVPGRFKPLSVLYEDQETLIKIKTDGGEFQTRRGPQEFPGLVIGGPVSETGTLLFGFGALIYITQGGERWFELCAPEHWVHARRANAVFVPSAELYVNGGTPVLTTHFEHLCAECAQPYFEQ